MLLFSLGGILHFIVGLGKLFVELLDRLDLQEDVLELALITVGSVARFQERVNTLSQLLLHARDVRHLLLVEFVLFVAV